MTAELKNCKSFFVKRPQLSSLCTTLGRATSQEYICSIIQTLFLKTDSRFGSDHIKKPCCHGDFNGVYTFYDRKCRSVCTLI